MPYTIYVHGVIGDHALQYCKRTWHAFEAYLIPFETVKVICQGLTLSVYTLILKQM
jgi:hypothetical protein